MPLFFNVVVIFLSSIVLILQKNGNFLVVPLSHSVSNIMFFRPIILCPLNCVLETFEVTEGTHFGQSCSKRSVQLYLTTRRHTAQIAIFFPGLFVNKYSDPLDNQRIDRGDQGLPFIMYVTLGTAVAQWLRYCATNQKVAGSIPNGVIGIFHWHNPSDRTMALGSTQPVTEMSTRSLPGGKCGRCVELTTLQPSCAVVMKSGNLNFLEPFGPLQACNGAVPICKNK
jgi:hypothetical protein